MEAGGSAGASGLALEEPVAHAIVEAVGPLKAAAARKLWLAVQSLLRGQPWLCTTRHSFMGMWRDKQSTQQAVLA